MTTQITSGYNLVTSDKAYAIRMASMHNIHINKINLAETMLNKMSWPPGDCITVYGQDGGSRNLLIDIPYGMALLHKPERKKGKANKYWLASIYSSKTALRHFKKDIPIADPITFDNMGKVVAVTVPKTKNSKFNKVLSDIIAKVSETVPIHKEAYRNW